MYPARGSRSRVASRHLLRPLPGDSPAFTHPLLNAMCMPQDDKTARSNPGPASSSSSPTRLVTHPCSKLKKDSCNSRPFLSPTSTESRGVIIISRDLGSGQGSRRLPIPPPLPPRRGAPRMSGRRGKGCWFAWKQGKGVRPRPFNPDISAPYLITPLSNSRLWPAGQSHAASRPSSQVRLSNWSRPCRPTINLRQKSKYPSYSSPPDVRGPTRA